jgi:hypothetical protein
MSDVLDEFNEIEDIKPTTKPMSQALLSLP